MKVFEVGQPTVRGRASVIQADLKLVFLSKEQRDRFVTELLADPIALDFDLRSEHGDSIVMSKLLRLDPQHCVGQQLSTNR